MLEKLADVDYFVPPAFACDWHRSCFLRTLDKAVSEAAQKYKIRLRDEIRALTSTCPTPVVGSLRRKWVDKRVQQHLSDVLLVRLGHSYDAETALANKLSRWDLSGVLRTQSRRAMAVLKKLGMQASPRISFTVGD